MKKIMFNDRYGLTNAVIHGSKTMTRRVVKDANLLQWLHEMEVAEYSIKGTIVEEYSPYKVGEVVAVAQSYERMANGGYLDRMIVQADNAVGFEFKPEYCGKGWKNKMFVKPDLMPHQIHITDFKVERLQDISDEDCFKEGVYRAQIPFGFYVRGINLKTPYYEYDTGFEWKYKSFKTPREAFVALIDKVSGCGTWECNPWVFVYEFELEKGGEQ